MKKIIYGALSFAPVLAFAQNSGQQTLGNIESLVQAFGRIVRAGIPIAFGIAIVYFFWGVAKYIGNANEPKSKDEGKSIMIGGVIAIAVMVSVFGSVTYLQQTFGVNQVNTIQPPTIQGL